MPDPLVVFGSGGHAKVIVEAVLARTPDRAILLIDDSPNATGHELLGIAVSGDRHRLSASLKKSPVALAIGQNGARAELMEWLLANGHELETVVHPTAVVGATVKIGIGAFIAAGAILTADASIGPGAIVNTGATVDHDCEIGDAAHIAPGVNLCGNVRVGARTLVGVGSSVRPGITIGEDIRIGAGSVVINDLAGSGTFAGNPARRLR